MASYFGCVTVFLSTALLISLCVVSLGSWTDRSAITARINGANGLPILVSLIVSFLASLLVAIFAGVVGGVTS
jgi:hypothetical protein